MLLARYFLVCLSLFGAASCHRKSSSTSTSTNPPAQSAAKPVPILPPAEPWAAKPPAEWPQLVLTNIASFKGHTPLEGASSFLVKGPTGTVYAATANHLLGPNGGVNPWVYQGDLDRDLQSWQMYPRTKGKLTISIAGLGLQKPQSEASDWLLLKVKNDGKSLPSTPLALRPTPVKIGEEIFLAGVPYAQTNRAQNIYRGRVTQRESPDWFRYDLETPVNIVGFSGAPLLDKNGLVVGVMTVWFEPKMNGENFKEAGGQDATYIARRLASMP